MIPQEVFMDILALHRQGYSYRAIARKLSIHRNTVKKYVEGRRMPAYGGKKRREGILAPYRQMIRDWLEHDDYQATWIFDKIKQLGYAGSYDTVKIFVRSVKKQRARLAYLRFETMPGLQAQMDWADFRIGPREMIHAFVMALGFSRAMYVEFVERCTFEAFLDCHIHAFHFLGGVPTEVLYDNMKNVVIRRKGGTVNFNAEFVHFATHYGFTPRACPPYSPWVKGKVERPIDYIRRRFWKGYRFDSLEQCNRDVRRWLRQTANRRVHGSYGQPVTVRWQKELAHLGKLPASDYDTSLKLFRKVYKDCQVSYNGNRYLLPHEVVGKTVLLKIKKGRIGFYHDDRLLATYREPAGKHRLVENPLFYERLKYDKEQLLRKYRGSAKATRSPADATLFPQVAVRALADYDRLAGGASWNS